jgi:hypothetical protein
MIGEDFLADFFGDGAIAKVGTSPVGKDHVQSLLLQSFYVSVSDAIVHFTDSKFAGIYGATNLQFEVSMLDCFWWYW